MDNEPAGREGVGGATTGRGLLRERPWLVVSVVLVAAAGVLLWLSLPNAAFVVAALGATAWFYDERMRLKRKHDLVRLSGRNWVPRSELGDIDDADYVDDVVETDEDDTGEAGETEGGDD